MKKSYHRTAWHRLNSGEKMRLIGKVILIILIACTMWILQFHAHRYGEEEIDTSDSKMIVHMTRSSGEQLELDMNAYLIGVLGSEMSPTYELEALKAQCVAARTFAASRNYQVDDTTNTQVYRDEPQLREAWGSNYESYYAKLKQAVLETEDEIMWYDDKPISALFYAQSCGHSANAEEYFENPIPYLVSVPSTSDELEEDHEETYVFTMEDFMQALHIDDPITSISKPERYASGYVKSVIINDQSFSGREVREALQLRSSAFTIQYDQESVELVTKGYGHGVGMSQRGANAMAKAGNDYRSILNHYYTGVEIRKP